MRWHTQNLSYDKMPTWRHGRGWWFNHRLKAEWSCFRDPYGLRSVALWRWGFSIYIPWFGLHLTLDEKGRDWQLSWHSGSLWIDHPWVREMEWRSADPWWKKQIVLHVGDWLLGRTHCDHMKGEPREVIVPLPEGSYRAEARDEVFVWTRRWYVPTRRRDSVWLDIHGGIPFAGKGENSYDCGDDGLWGCGGDTLEKAIAHAVESVLKERRRYGHDSKGTGRVPVLVVNASAPARAADGEAGGAK